MQHSHFIGYIMRTTKTTAIGMAKVGENILVENVEFLVLHRRLILLADIANAPHHTRVFLQTLLVRFVQTVRAKHCSPEIGGVTRNTLRPAIRFTFYHFLWKHKL